MIREGAGELLPDVDSAKRICASYGPAGIFDRLNAAAAHEFEQTAMNAEVSTSVLPDLGQEVVTTRSTVRCDGGRRFCDQRRSA
jgi:hypothetical protein